MSSTTAGWPGGSGSTTRWPPPPDRPGALAAAGLGPLRRAWPASPSEGRFFLVLVPAALVGLSLAGRLTSSVERRPTRPGRPSAAGSLGVSRPVVVRLAGLFAMDSFGGGFVVQSFIAFWLAERFGASIGVLGVTFFAIGLLQTGSFLAAAPLAERFGLLATMVFTHLPSNVLLIAVAFAPSLPVAIGLLLARVVLSQMDVPTRQVYVMALVDPGERTAAAGFTNTARYLVRPLGPVLAGAAQTFGLGAPFVIAGTVKGAYDLILSSNRPAPRGRRSWSPSGRATRPSTPGSPPPNGMPSPPPTSTGLRLVASLATRSVRASDILRVSQGGGRPTALGRALAEYGRIPKTFHLLSWLDDPAYRGGVGGQLNLQESRHRLARKIFHGSGGQLRQAYREGQEDQLSALGLVLNAVVLWNTYATPATPSATRTPPGSHRWATATSTWSAATPSGQPRLAERPQARDTRYMDGALAPDDGAAEDQ